jgi:hypothetical protein
MGLSAELNMTRRFGVEHEMTLPLVGRGSGSDIQHCLANILTANGIRAVARDYSHDPVPADADICVERDASVRGETRFSGIAWYPVEIKTRILSGISDWEAIIPRTLEVCRYLGARTNVSCGHHVHVEFMEARDQPTKIRSLFNLIHRFEPLVFALQPPSRRLNSYCSPILGTASRALHGCRSIRCFRRVLANWDRHMGLNLTHVFEPNPRIEFRYAAGTLDPVKARHWMRFLNRLVEHAVTRNCQAARQQVVPSLPGWDNMVWTIGMRAHQGIYGKIAPEIRETAKFLRRRLKHLSPEICGISSAVPSSPNQAESED